MTEDTVFIEWSYTPDSYFEDEFETNLTLGNYQYKMAIKKGKVEVHIDLLAYNQESNIHKRLYEKINNIFKARLLINSESFKIYRGSIVHIYYANGTKGVKILTEPAKAYAEGSKPLINSVVKDDKGNVIRDSRKERIDNNKGLIDLVSRCESKDSFAVSLLDCLDRAVNNEKHELVHLYEIREALVNKFGNQQSVRQSLGISRNDWSRLGELANDLPLMQGRHVGKKIEELRDATSAELNEARQLAQRFVKAYLNYLDAD